MPVDTKHNDYVAAANSWAVVRDCVAGEETVKARGSLYLPKLSGQDDTEYKAYKMRAMFYGATGRTREGLLGAVFRKDPTLVLPSQLEGIEEDADLSGTPLSVFARRIVQEVLTTGRVGVLTDFSNDRPYLVSYSAEQIINWHISTVDGKPATTLITLQETTPAISQDDPYMVQDETRYRVLLLDENGDYNVSVYKKTDNAEEFILLEGPIYPVKRGETFNRIPFQFFSPSDLASKVSKPPLYDLATVNLSHYRSSADLEHGLHWTALPTPWVSGVSDPKTVLHIGSNKAWALPEGGNAGMLEFSGAGLSAIKDSLLQKENLMAQLGARLLEDQKKAAETAESKRLQYSGENSILASISRNVSEGLSRNLKIAAEWTGANPEDASIDINRDFFDQKMTGAELKEIVEAWQRNAIPKSTLYYQLKQGEILQPDMEEEQYLEETQDDNDLSGLTGISSRTESVDG